MTAKDCYKASSQGVGYNDGTNDPRGYSKVSIWEYPEVERQNRKLRQASRDLVNDLGSEEPLKRSVLFQNNNSKFSPDSLALKATILCRWLT